MPQPPSALAACRPQLRLITWKAIRKGKLRGFATVVVLPIGLRLVDCAVFGGGKNGAWAALPSKSELDRDGQRKTDANGQPIYVPVCEWTSRELADRFSSGVVALVRRAHPEDLED